MACSFGLAYNFIKVFVLFNIMHHIIWEKKCLCDKCFFLQRSYFIYQTTGQPHVLLKASRMENDCMTVCIPGCAHLRPASGAAHLHLQVGRL